MNVALVRRLADIIALLLGSAGVLVLIIAFGLWLSSPPLVLGVEGKPAIIATDGGPRPTTEVVVQPTLNSITAHDTRMSQVRLAFYLGSGFLLGAAACYGALRAIARFRALA